MRVIGMLGSSDGFEVEIRGRLEDYQPTSEATMPAVSDIIHFIESRSGHPLNRDEGVQHRPPGAVQSNSEAAVSGVTVAWMATPDALRSAGEHGHELFIGHESLYYPYDVVNATNPPDGWKEWKVNRQRRELLDAGNLTFLRAHGSLDEICIFDDFAALLDLGRPVHANALTKVYEIAPCTVGELVERTKQVFGMPTLRVAAVNGMDQIVHRVGLPWGGLGLFVNVGYQQQLVELGCDVFIAGEADDYGFRFAVEAGIPMIETSHEISENPGLRHFAEMLAAEFPGINVAFYENPCVWEAR
jgi:putative NIF3 family GTP cyclohydrolase 1 type 2